MGSFAATLIFEAGTVLSFGLVELSFDVAGSLECDKFREDLLGIFGILKFPSFPFLFAVVWISDSMFSKNLDGPPTSFVGFFLFVCRAVFPTKLSGNAAPTGGVANDCMSLPVAF